VYYVVRDRELSPKPVVALPREEKLKPLMAAAPSPAPPRILHAGDAHGRLHQLLKRVKSVSPAPYHPPLACFVLSFVCVSLRAR
jgi:hypothetical protein